ncbi:hypothetical protein Angca_002594, partial [Angiostrongylus cantonensis]
GASKSIEDVVKETKNTRLRTHVVKSTVLPALTYASEPWSLRRQDEKSLGVIELRSSDLRQRPKIKDAVLYAEQSKISWAGHVMRINDNRWTRAVSEWIPA